MRRIHPAGCMHVTPTLRPNGATPDNDVKLHAGTFLARPVAVGIPIRTSEGHQWRGASCTSHHQA